MRTDFNSRHAVVGLAGFLVINALAIALCGGSMSLLTLGLALGIFWLGVLPMAVYIVQPPDARVAFPLLGFTGLMYGVFFGVTALLLPVLNAPGASGSLYVLPAPKSILVSTQLLTLGGLGLCIGAYIISNRYLFVEMPRFRISGQEASRRILLLAWVLLLAHLAYLYIPQIRHLPSVGQFLQPIGYLSLGLFFVKWRKRELNGLPAVLVWLIVFPLIVWKMVVTGFLTPLILLGLFLLCLEVWVSRRVPWVPLSSAGLVFLLAFLFTGHVRGAFYSAEFEGWSLSERLSRIAQAVSDQYSSSTPLHHKMVDWSGKITRISHILVFDRVVKLTPEEVPYWGGETYKPLATSFVPRAAWPDKPLEIAGNVFGHRYGFLHPTERGISVNIPWITEMYANFGTPGALLGMGLVGIFLSALQRFFCRQGMTELETVAGMTIIFPLFYQESNFSVMVGSLLPLSVCIWLYFTVGLRLPLPAWTKL